MDDKKICFIICANNEIQLRECRLYIDNLIIPEGFSVEIEEVWNAKSMTGGYNQGMKRSMAKYKIYLHQDVLIINRRFLIEIVKLFQEYPKLGMIGMVGNTRLGKEITPWSEGAVRIGQLYADVITKNAKAKLGMANGKKQNVISIDGLLMATQYDLSWREDLFQGWDMYDLSQSMEFWRAGYEVAVPYMEEPWVFHDNDVLNMENYEKWKKIFVREYRRDYTRWSGKQLEGTKPSRAVYQILDKKQYKISFPYPPLYEEDADYLCFTDCKNLTSSYWNLIFVEDVNSSETKEKIEKILSGYKECREIKQNEIQTDTLFGKEQTLHSVMKVPTFEELGISGFQPQNIVSVKDENGNYKYEKNPVYTDGKYEGREYLLTIGMPVSNQIRTIDRCLSHIKPLLDQLDAELVVADTGSTDGTIEVCREYGAKIIHFPWCDNMSAARNAVMRNAKGLWYLSIDDDEWFENTEEISDFFISGKYKNYDAASYVQRNYMDQGKDDYVDFHALRLVKIREKTHFEGRIHDAIVIGVTQGIQICNLGAYAHHYGFARDDMNKVADKVRRNLRGLLSDIYEFPEDLRYIFQFANEYQVITDYVAAVKVFSVAVSMSKELHKYQKMCAINLFGCVASLADENLIHYFDMLKEYVEYTDAEWAYMYYELAHWAYNSGNKSPQEILKYCKNVEEYIRKYEKNKRENWEATEKGLYICTDKNHIMDIRIIALKQYLTLNDSFNSIKTLDKIEWQYVKENEELLIDSIWNSEKVVFDYAINRISPYIYERWGQSFLNQMVNSVRDIISEDALYKAERVLEKINIHTLEVSMQKIDGSEKMMRLFDYKIGDNTSIQKKWIRMYALKEKYRKNKQNQNNLPDSLERFLLYCEAVYKFVKSYYCPDVLETENVLPLEQSAAYHVAKAVFLEKCDMKQRISCLSRAVREFPGFKTEIEQMIKQLNF